MQLGTYLHKNPVPWKKRLYRRSYREIEALWKQLERLLDQRSISSSSSHCGASVLFSAKKNGALRLCVDYRALNEVRVKNRFSLPTIDDIFDQLSAAKYFSNIDLQLECHLILMEPESIPLAVFSKIRSPWFFVPPTGLTNALAIFRDFMNILFLYKRDTFATTYLDDTLVYSKTILERLQDIETILKKAKSRKAARKAVQGQFCSQQSGIFQTPHLK